MNTIVTSREAILAACRTIVAEQGLSQLNMRLVAQRCHVALGSLYYYFPSKEALLEATVESVWRDIFHMEHGCEQSRSFPDYIQWMFTCVQKSAEEYPHFLSSHSVGFATGAKRQARSAMTQCLSHIKTGMALALEADPTVDPHAFSPAFPREDFLDFVLTSLLTLLMQESERCDLLLTIIRRTITSSQ